MVLRDATLGNDRTYLTRIRALVSLVVHRGYDVVIGRSQLRSLIRDAQPADRN